MTITATDSQAVPGDAPLPGFAQRLQKLWHSRPVRTQILLAFLAVTLTTSLIAGAVKLLDASNRASVEMRAAVSLAESFVRETTHSIASEEEARNLSRTIASRLQHLRHVRITVLNANSETIPPTASGNGAADARHQVQSQDVPRWFVELVQPAPEFRRVLITISKQPLAVVLIQGEPSDEIAEVWQDFRTLLIMWLVTNIIILGVLYVVLGRILDPLVGLASAMKRLELGNSAVRVERPKVQELALIADRFNHLASALDIATAENSRLCRDLIGVQEEERRQIASELHDEVGPCLFGIMVSASSIEQYVKSLPPDEGTEVTNRLGEVRSICDRLKFINRQMLKKLRPIVLGRITIKELIARLSSEFEDRHPEVRFLTITSDLQSSYGELIDLTIYRCVQEGITNALRHAQPSNIVIELSQESTPAPDGGTASSLIRLVIRDDGIGIDDPAPIGFGLGTMRERVRTLQGDFSLGRNWPAGTAISITIPTGTPADAEKISGELFGTSA